MRQEVDALAAKVAELDVVEDSAVALLDGLKARLDDALATADWAKVQDLANDIGGQSASLAAAVARNTPADPNAGGTGDPVNPGSQGSQGDGGEITT